MGGLGKEKMNLQLISYKNYIGAVLQCYRRCYRRLFIIIRLIFQKDSYREKWGKTHLLFFPQKTLDKVKIHFCCNYGLCRTSVRYDMRRVRPVYREYMLFMLFFI